MLELLNMDVIETAEEYITELFSEHYRHSGGGRLKLFYTIELASEEGEARSDYNQRASELQQELTKQLTNSRRFITVHLDQTIDPYIVLGDECPDLTLSEEDQRIRDLAERDRDRSPWPSDIGIEVNDYLDGETDPTITQERQKNVVAFEVSVQGGSDAGDGWGTSAPIENTRQLFNEFVDETDDVESMERWYPFQDDDTYGFAFQKYEIRVRTILENGWPHVEWEVGSADRRGRGIGWVGVVDDDDFGHSNGRFYFSDSRNEYASEYIDDDVYSIPIPEPIAEALLADAQRKQREAALDRELSEDSPTPRTEESTGTV